MHSFLVTGGCGFIGTALTHHLVAAGNRVRVLDDLSTGEATRLPPQAELVVADVANPSAVAGAMEGMDGCFHLAAVASVQRCHDDWLGGHAVNLGGTLSVFSAARLRRTPVVYASSAAVYGANESIPLGEDSPTVPISAYGADKLGCEMQARIAAQFGVPTTGLRFFNVYGAHQSPESPYSGVISIFSDRLLRGEPLTLCGSGAQMRDFIFVDDVVAHLLAAMATISTEPRVLNVCTGRPTTVRDLAELLGELSGRKPVFVSAPARTGDIKVSLGDPSAARRELGVTAATPLRTGLAATLDWMRSRNGQEQGTAPVKATVRSEFESGALFGVAPTLQVSRTEGGGEQHSSRNPARHGQGRADHVAAMAKMQPLTLAVEAICLAVLWRLGVRGPSSVGWRGNGGRGQEKQR